MLTDAVIQAKADAKAKEWEAGEPQRAEHRARQKAEDAAFEASFPEDVEDLTMDQINAQRKGGRTGEFFLNKAMAEKYLYQLGEQDMSGRPTYRVDPKIKQALHNTAIYGRPPRSGREVWENLVSTGDAVDVASFGAIPAGDTLMMAEAAVTGNRDQAALAGLGFLPVIGTSLKRTAMAAGNKARELAAAGISHAATDPRLRYRAAQTASNLNPKRADPRINVGRTTNIKLDPANLEDYQAAKASADRFAELDPEYREIGSRLEEAVDHYDEVSHTARLVQTRAIGDLLLDPNLNLSPETLAYVERLRKSRPNVPHDYLLHNAMDNGYLWVVDGQGTRTFISEHNMGDFLGEGSLAKQALTKSNNSIAEAGERMTALEQKLNISRDKRLASWEALQEIDVDTYKGATLPHLRTSPSAVKRPLPKGRKGEMIERVESSLADNGMIRTSEVSTSTAHLKHLLSEGFVLDPTMKRIAVNLSKDPRLNDVPIAHGRMVDKPTSSGGHYDSGDHVIIMQPTVTRSYVPDVIHEMAHALTVPAMYRGRDLRAALNATGEMPTGFADTSALNLWDSMEDMAFQLETRMKSSNPNLRPQVNPRVGLYAANDPLQRAEGLNYHYGGAGAGEFISEFYAKAKFRQMLKETPYIHAGDETLSLFDVFLTKIADVLRFTDEDTHLLFSATEAVDQYRKRASLPSSNQAGEAINIRPNVKPYYPTPSPE